MPTAILVDGGFFLKRFSHVYRDRDATDPKVVARTMHEMACFHLNDRQGRPTYDLYRIFFYDCPPILKKAHLPISRRGIDFSKTTTALFRLALHEEIKTQRKVALRLGHLSDGAASWRIKSDKLSELIKGNIRFEELTDDDFTYDARQKGVDMKIGLDIASLAYKKLVDQIVLVAGDSDFVPAAKLARREGIDFVLDPMWHNIHPSLNEHIDGLRSTSPNPSKFAQ
ncbi:NYN domain-containing protein [Polyangium jinanense]|uniref:NYN domain-containing protein n=1 Tax=Polyangium jinanense TaxID=2829994 RepID=A0A9X3WX94_9BACT|nr:NYN domain-containing protein [Polyangium jinanense]MDC3952348.1 NYN domain-containing protein [Polyangium jinanense]MDC3979977.1 NYN domain-containing protein [Polyangium jinanense]